MTYEAFKEYIETQPFTPYVEQLWHYPDGNKFGAKAAPKFDYAASRVEIGGAAGGNCWGNSADGYTVAEAEDGYGFIDTIINNLFPNTTYATYRKIVAALQTHEETSYKYYGNYTTYRVRWIKLEDLYKLLCA
jgi:hypothetical protein